MVTGAGRGPGRAHALRLARMGEPEDCARVIEFLCTDLSAYVTGQCIAVCGGWYAGAC